MMIHGRTKHVQNLDRDSHMRTMARTARSGRFGFL